jgi:EAL domain-containing protein (putative c-di-GMP-specific phosphodiesterase class I)
VRNVDQSASDAAIANAILALGESLGLTVTAEGIERPRQERLVEGDESGRQGGVVEAGSSKPS